MYTQKLGLEKFFNVKSFQIKKISKEEQTNFFQNYNNLGKNLIDTVKLLKVKRLPKRIKYEFVTANRTRTFLLFLCFFFKKFGSVQFDRNELQN